VTAVQSNLLDNLQNLKYLEISESRLQTLPAQFLSRNGKIKKLKLQHNLILSLPETIFENLSQVTEIDLSGNQLEKVPENLFNSNKNLTTLRWNYDRCPSSNKTRIFPENFLQNNLHLKHFSYSVHQTENSFCEEIIFPDNLFSSQLKHLENLTVSQTPLNWNQLSPLFTHLESVTHLDFSENNISEINPVTVRFDLNPKPNSIPIPKDKTVITNLRLEGNTFDCNSCDTLQFLIDYNSNPNPKPNPNPNHNPNPNSSQELKCKNGKNNQDPQLYHIANGYSIFCESEKIYPFLLLTLLLIFAAILVIIYSNKRLQIWLYNQRVISTFFFPEKDDASSKAYDVFISYADGDADLAEDIVWKLEDPKNGLRRTFRCCVHSRDWIPGKEICSNIYESVNASRRTLILLSPKFLKSTYCNQEFRSVVL
jgi:hypothetical protein